MNLREKAEELYSKIYGMTPVRVSVSMIEQDKDLSKSYAVLFTENEYKSNRELLFNLRSCGVIENEKVYLSRLQGLIDEEVELIKEIKKLPA